MGPSSLASFIRRLRRLVEPCGGGLDDTELLKRFATERDEAAFEVLLWRYGPLVLSVCRRMLWREQDVEDAFQATFLTLVRKAGSIARREALGGWLHQVAYRIGLRARARATRHGIPDQERVETAVAHSQHNDDGEWREVLDQEVQRLPSRYRTPFIFCYLEGKTHAEAARLLACPPGTVASRLAWARDRLRRRLTARGLTLPAVLACLIVPAELQAASLAVLIATALRTARLFTTGTLTGSETIPVHVTAWSKGAVRAMFLSKIQLAASLIVASILVGAGGGVFWQRVQAGGTDPALADEPAAQATAQPEKKPKIATPPAEPKPGAAHDFERLQRDLEKAESDYLALVDKWEKQIDPVRRELLERQQDQRQRKARLAFEVKRKNRALELAESRVEKLTQALDQADPQTRPFDTLQKNLEEANKHVEKLSAELLKSEMILAEEDSPFNRLEHEVESLEKRRTFEIARARKSMEAAERKLHPDDAADNRLQELERKVDALTRAVEDLRKALRR